MGRLIGRIERVYWQCVIRVGISGNDGNRIDSWQNNSPIVKDVEVHGHRVEWGRVG